MTVHTCPNPYKLFLPTQQLNIIIGASLSEPPTSMTALGTCVCIYACLDRPLTVKYFTKTECPHRVLQLSHGSELEELLPARRQGWRERG